MKVYSSSEDVRQCIFDVTTTKETSVVEDTLKDP